MNTKVNMKIFLTALFAALSLNASANTLADMSGSIKQHNVWVELLRDGNRVNGLSYPNMDGKAMHSNVFQKGFVSYECDLSTGSKTFGQETLKTGLEYIGVHEGRYLHVTINYYHVTPLSESQIEHAEKNCVTAKPKQNIMPFKASFDFSKDDELTKDMGDGRAIKIRMISEEI